MGVLRALYSRSPQVGSPVASILQTHISGIPTLLVLNPVSNFLRVTRSSMGFSPKSVVPAAPVRYRKSGGIPQETPTHILLGFRGLGFRV